MKRVLWSAALFASSACVLSVSPAQGAVAPDTTTVETPSPSTGLQIPDVKPAAVSGRLDDHPVAADETSFAYRGKRISVSYAASHDLACTERDGKTKCYDGEVEMERAEHTLSVSERVAAAAARRQGKKPKRRASAANHGGDPYSLWEHSSRVGWRVDTYTSCNWYNLTEGYNDNASSLVTGSHSGFLSRHNYGGGEQFEKVAYQTENHLSSYYAFTSCGAFGCVDSTWNDQASSRRRGGC